MEVLRIDMGKDLPDGCIATLQIENSYGSSAIAGDAAKDKSMAAIVRCGVQQISVVRHGTVYNPKDPTSKALYRDSVNIADAMCVSCQHRILDTSQGTLHNNTTAQTSLSVIDNR